MFEITVCILLVGLIWVVGASLHEITEAIRAQTRAMERHIMVTNLGEPIVQAAGKAP